MVSFKTTSACELKGAMFRVVEVEWTKFTLFFFSKGRFKKSVTFNRLKVHVDAHFNVKMLPSSKSDVDRQTD